MASASFTINGMAPTSAIAVTGGTTVDLALASTTGVSSVAWSIVGNHSPSATNPTITPAGTPSGATASFTMPVGAGQAYIVQCVVNGGVDTEGHAVAAQTATGVVGVYATTGYVPFAAGEVTERSATHGWTPDLNTQLAAAIAAAGYASPTGGTAYRVTYSTAGDSNLWSTTVWSDGTYMGFAATAGGLPSSGAVRLGGGYAIVVKGSSADYEVLFSADDGASTDIYTGHASLRHFYALAGTDCVFQIGGTTQFTIANGYVSIGTSAAGTGTVRAGTTFSIYGKNSGTSNTSLLGWTSSTDTLTVGDGTNVAILDHAAATQQTVKVGGVTMMTFDVGGTTVPSGKELDVTTAYVRTSTGSWNTWARGEVLSDTGSDGAPVALVSYTIPEGYAAKLECWVRGEVDSTQVTTVDAVWTMKWYRLAGGNATEYSAAVTPNSEMDPGPVSNITITYSATGGVVTIYKQNDTSTAWAFSGIIAVTLDNIVGAGT